MNRWYYYFLILLSLISCSKEDETETIDTRITADIIGYVHVLDAYTYPTHDSVEVSVKLFNVNNELAVVEQIITAPGNFEFKDIAHGIYRIEITSDSYFKVEYSDLEHLGGDNRILEFDLYKRTDITFTFDSIYIVKELYYLDSVLSETYFDNEIHIVGEAICEDTISNRFFIGVFSFADDNRIFQADFETKREYPWKFNFSFPYANEQLFIYANPFRSINPYNLEEYEGIYEYVPKPDTIVRNYYIESK